MWITAICVCAFFASARPNIYGELETLPGDPFAHTSWNWRSQYNWPADKRSGDVSVEDESREPLDPNYKDPQVGGSNSKPVVTPRPSLEGGILPGGVLNINAGDGLPSFSDIQSNLGNFGFGFGNSQPGGLFGLGGFFGLGGEEFRPWWKGANVCIEREESTDDEDSKVNKTLNRAENFFSTSISLSNCQQTPNKYECQTKINNHGVVKTFTVRYKCCYGFQREFGSPGCSKQVTLKSLMNTIEDLEGKEFKSLVEMVGLKDAFENENFTVFLPTDEAFSEFDSKMDEMNAVELKRRRRDAVSTGELIRNHMVSGFIDIHEMYNDELLYSDNNNKSIRINIYPSASGQKMITANCAPITKSNNFASNGIVHVINGVIQPATKTIAEILSENEKLSFLRNVLEQSDLINFFKDDSQYTLFAPTNEAFDKLEKDTRNMLMEGKMCTANIIKHHITKHTICSAAISGNATTHNIVGEILNMQRTDENKLIIENSANVLKSDIIASNGVIHLVDTVIVPDTALRLNEALKENNMTKFKELIELAGMSEDFESFENATVFVPSDEALSEPGAKAHLENIQGDTEKLREFVRYHVVKGEIETCNLENNALLETEAEGKSLRINLYSTLPVFANIINRATVNCARLTNFDEVACGTILHEVDKVLLPPEETILELIQNDERYSTLASIINGTEIENILQDEKRSISFVAPDNEAFKNIDAADMKTLQEDKEKAVAVLKNHILSEVLCCSGVGPQTFGFNNVIPTLGGQHQQISRSGNRQVRVGRAQVTKCDSTAKNGVVHTINRVLFPQRPPHPHLGFFLFDL